MKTVIAVLAVVLALPAGALARTDPGQPKALGTDVAAPDQQSPIELPRYLATRGTDVAAPDQQAPKVVPAADSGFDWSDAGVGALTAVLVGSASLGAVLFVRRRHPAATGA